MRILCILIFLSLSSARADMQMLKKCAQKNGIYTCLRMSPSSLDMEGSCLCEMRSVHLTIKVRAFFKKLRLSRNRQLILRGN